ncbi:hypothetical protein ACWD25_56415 [Streptomyces sp. NPDC002920]
MGVERARNGLVAVVRWCVLAVLLLCAAAGPAYAAGSPAGRARDAPAAAPAVTVPAGVTAGVAVFDRQTGTFTEQLNPRMRFRSASVVKLLIALDHLWNKGPGYSLSTDDRARFDLMLPRL